MDVLSNLDSIISLDNSVFPIKADREWYTRYKNAKLEIETDGDEIVGYTLASYITEDLYIALVNNVLIGDYCIDPSMFVEKSKYVYYASVVVKEEYRNRGIGSRLVSDLLKQFDGCSIVCFACSQSRGIFEKLGFKSVTHNPNEIFSVFVK